MNEYILDFEFPLKEIQNKIDELKASSVRTGIDVSDSINDLRDKLENKRKNIYSNLSRWQKVQLARHPNRPYSKDYIGLII